MFIAGVQKQGYNPIPPPLPSPPFWIRVKGQQPKRGKRTREFAPIKILKSERPPFVAVYKVRLHANNGDFGIFLIKIHLFWISIVLRHFSPTAWFSQKSILWARGPQQHWQIWRKKFKCATSVKLQAFSRSKPRIALSIQWKLVCLTLIRMTKDEKVLDIFKGLLL